MGLLELRRINKKWMEYTPSTFYLFFLPVDRNIAGVLHIVADDVEAAGKRNFTYTVDRKRRTKCNGNFLVSIRTVDTF